MWETVNLLVTKTQQGLMLQIIPLLQLLMKENIYIYLFVGEHFGLGRCRFWVNDGFSPPKKPNLLSLHFVSRNQFCTTSALEFSTVQLELLFQASRSLLLSPEITFICDPLILCSGKKCVPSHPLRCSNYILLTHILLSPVFPFNKILVELPWPESNPPPRVSIIVYSSSGYASIYR